VKFLFDAPAKALVIGMRDGAVARQFAADGWNTEAVDSDPRAARIARQFFGWRDGAVAVTVDEPRTFLRQSSKTWDVIVLDAFQAQPLPARLLTREFVAIAAHRLAATGVLVVSIQSVGWDDPIVGAVGATLATKFTRVSALPTGEPPNTLGSIVLYAANR